MLSVLVAVGADNEAVGIEVIHPILLTFTYLNINIQTTILLLNPLSIHSFPIALIGNICRYPISTREYFYVKFD